MPTKTKRRTKTKYQKMVKAFLDKCKGKKTVKEVRKIAQDYYNDAIKKGKSKKEAKAIVDRAIKRPCPVVVAGTKKK